MFTKQKMVAKSNCKKCIYIYIYIYLLMNKYIFANEPSQFSSTL